MPERKETSELIMCCHHDHKFQAVLAPSRFEAGQQVQVQGALALAGGTKTGAHGIYTDVTVPRIYQDVAFQSGQKISSTAHCGMYETYRYNQAHIISYTSIYRCSTDIYRHTRRKNDKSTWPYIRLNTFGEKYIAVYTAIYCGIHFASYSY
jgi:hypothetical protein